MPRNNTGRQLLAKVQHARSRRTEAGQAQGEAILNAAQLCQLMLRRKPAWTVRAWVSADGCDLAGRILQPYPIQIEQLSLPVRQGGCGVGGLSLKHGGAFASSWAVPFAPVLARLPDADACSVTDALQAGDRSHPVAAALLQAHDTLRACGVPDSKLPDWGPALWHHGAAVSA